MSIELLQSHRPVARPIHLRSGIREMSYLIFLLFSLFTASAFGQFPVPPVPVPLPQPDPRLLPAARMIHEAREAERANDIAGAIELRERANAIGEEVLGSEHPFMATPLYDLAELYGATRNFTRALSLHEHSLRIHEKTPGNNARSQVADSLNALGRIYESLGKYSIALSHYERSLEINEGLFGPDHWRVAGSLSLLASVYSDTDELPRAQQLYARSLAIVEKAFGPDAPDLAIGLSNLANVHHSMGEYAQALSLYEKSLEITEKRVGPEHPDVARTLNRMAWLYMELSEFAKSSTLHDRNLAIIEKAYGPDTPQLADVLNSLGEFHRNTANYEQALTLYERSLAIYEKAYGPDHDRVATLLNNRALLFRAMGDYGRSLASHERSVEIWQKMYGPSHWVVALALGNLATLYRVMGESSRALPLYERSLAIYEGARGPDHVRVAATLYYMALVHVTIGEYARALPMFEKSLAIREKLLGPENAHVARTLAGMAMLYRRTGDFSRSLSLFERSLQIRQKVFDENHPEVAENLNDLASLHEEMGDFQRPLTYRNRAYLLVSEHRDPQIAWQVQDGLRRLWVKKGVPETAIWFGKQAVSTIQSLRARSSKLDPEIQRSLVGDKRDVYEGLAKLLIEAGRLPEAQSVLAMLKEEEFFDYLRRDESRDGRTTEVGFTAKEQAWQSRYQSIANRVAALGVERESLRGKARKGVLTANEQQRMDELTENLEVARRAFEAFLAEVVRELADSAVGDSRKLEIGEKNLRDLRSIQGTLRELGERAGAPVAVLHYLVTRDRLHMIVTTSGTQVSRVVPVDEKALNAKIAAYRNVLQDSSRDPLPLAKELYALVLAPVAEDLRQAQISTLMVSLDGTLRYLPLGALHDGNDYFARHYRVAIFTEAAKDKIKDAPLPNWKFAGLGLTRQVPGFTPLPSVKEELQGIVRTSGGAGILPGEVILDEAFTAARMKRALLQAYPVLHIASHFVFKPGTESSSFLLLGDGTRLSLTQLKANDYDFGGLDLITLSACETAVGGGQDANGREIEGFGALAQRQGAKGVIATLWPVADESTGLFMREFYRVREMGLTKAEAMRRAQMALMQGALDQGESASGERGVTRIDSGVTQFGLFPISGSRYAHPYFWAPFILMGNWL